MKLVFTSLEELMSFVNAMGGATPTMAPTPEAPKPEKAKPSKKAETTEAALVAAPVETAPAPTDTAPTLENVRARLTEIHRGGKPNAVKELLAAFGVQKLTDLPVDKYTAILEAAGV